MGEGFKLKLAARHLERALVKLISSAFTEQSQSDTAAYTNLKCLIRSLLPKIWCARRSDGNQNGDRVDAVAILVSYLFRVE
jgi:hypothetical protein